MNKVESARSIPILSVGEKIAFEGNGKELYVVPPANPYPRTPFNNNQDALITTGGNKKNTVD